MRPGPYTLTGKDAASVRLFSFSFGMEVVADAEGKVAHFAFVLPFEPEWAGSLAIITLAAPDGSVTPGRRDRRPDGDRAGHPERPGAGVRAWLVRAPGAAGRVRTVLEPGNPPGGVEAVGPGDP